MIGALLERKSFTENLGLNLRSNYHFTPLLSLSENPYNS